MEGKILAAEWARKTKKPYLGNDYALSTDIGLCCLLETLGLMCCVFGPTVKL